jgi:hypothetical protein
LDTLLIWHEVCDHVTSDMQERVYMLYFITLVFCVTFYDM